MEDAVTCPVCCEVYRTGPREPLVLPCGHTVCRCCLNAILASDHGRLACPICRADVGVFDNLPVCFPLLSLSSTYCVFKYEYCDTHDEEQRYWCKECMGPLCSLCLYNDHPHGHRVMSVRAVVQDKREALKEQLASLGTEIKGKRRELKEHARQLVRVMNQMCTMEDSLGRLNDQVRDASSLGDLLDCEDSLQTFKDEQAEESSREEIARILQTKRDLDNPDSTVVMNLREDTPAVQGHQQQSLDQQQSTQHDQETDIDVCQELQAKFDYQDGRLLVHSLAYPVDTSLTLQLPSEVFLELSIGSRSLGRVYIRLWSHLRRAQQFLALCLGTLGPSYLGASFSHVAYMKKPKETLCCKEYLHSDGTPGKQELFNNLEWGGEFAKDPTKGFVIPLSKNIDEHGFGICTQSQPGGTFHCPFGEVVSGLRVVTQAIKHNSVTEVRISQCGMVLPDLPLS
ncbi:hypothetical protein Pcinc_035219 [Petrolisthes cinctipes]|uniref:Uncharacterized protein n=1 Tax=Petrolisthes cinctipes TaxID=88211 RepID=A0AAE1BYC6_PETCI|nr:hypothetical protein Pcinc_035219 [Petrolisthes cinctipes]